MDVARESLLLAEKNNVSYKDLFSIWDYAKKCIESGPDCITLYTTFIYMVRRYISADGSNNYEPVENIFVEALKAIDQFEIRFDHRAVELRKNFAFFLYDKSRKISKAREVWNFILAQKTDATTWLEAISMERAYGKSAIDNVEYVRNLFLKAVHKVKVRQQTLFYAFIQFEREEGTIHQLESALEIVSARNQNTQVSQTSRWNQQTKPKMEVKKDYISKETKEFPEKHEDKTSKIEVKRGFLNQETKEFPEKHEDKTSKIEVKRGFLNQETNQFSEKHEDKTSEISASSSFRVPRKRVRRETEDNQISESVSHETGEVETKNIVAPVNPECTVYLSNLDLLCTEEDIAKLFQGIKHIRLTHKPKSRQNKGFAFIEFVDVASAQNALAQDRKFVFSNRKIFISEYKEGKQPGQKTEFRYNVGLEKNKLFIRNLHFSCTEDELKEAFEKYGALKSIRIVTHKNGNPKGIAYVEFETEQAASEALKADGTKIHKRKISVLLSDPSVATAKAQSTEQSKHLSQVPQSSAGHSTTNINELPSTMLSRAPRLQMIPRSINKVNVVYSNGQCDQEKIPDNVQSQITQ